MTINFDLQSPAFENSPLAEIYYNVLNELKEGRPRPTISQRRVALWVAWESHRIAAEVTIGQSAKVNLLAVVGLPATVREFAKLIGVSPRTIRHYRQTHFHFVSTARETSVQRILAGYDLPALHALGESAAAPDHRHAPDRRIFFTMRGLLVDRSKVDLDVDVANLSDAELEALDSNL